MKLIIGNLKFTVEWINTGWEVQKPYGEGNVQYVYPTPIKARRLRKRIEKVYPKGRVQEKVHAIKALRKLAFNQTGKQIGLKEAKTLVERWGY